MIVELINTGNELMLGRVLNTHQQWLCRQLADLGMAVSRQVAVPDTAGEIKQAVQEALSRADLVITTGGLGPTSDDLTRDAIAAMLGRPMREHPVALAQVQNFFIIRNRPIPVRTWVEAQVPEGATVLPNRNGTAPGLAMEVPPGLFRTASAPGWLIMLPGPPRELRPMFSESVIPLLQRVFPAPQHFACKTFRTCGVGESMVQERIEKPMQTLVDAGLELGYCARPGQVDVRLVATGAKATELVKSAEAVLRTHLSESIYAEGDEGLEDIVIRLLTQQKRTVAVAESCTGGFITHRLTNVPGASAVFKGGFVTYSNELKQRILGVRAETLSGHGAVSEAVAREMAEGARRISESDYAISTTGIAGPDGGTPEKPVGTVFIALANSKETRVWKMFNPWDRVTFKDVTAEQALNQLRLSLAGI